ncbi:MAG: hypothetical protein WDA41_08335 [Candidatus Neomarinimicrobiota bacterium]
MNIKEVKDETLKLIERYSVSGNTVALTYNGQSDYLLRMIGLINDAQMVIATAAKKIAAEYKVTKTEGDEDTWVEYSMPVDFYQRGNGGSIFLDNKLLRNGEEVKWMSASKFVVRGDLAGSIYAPYYRFPVKITTATPESTELDNSKDTHILIAYYVAAMLVQQDNPYLAATLYNNYETKLSRLEEGLEVSIDSIGDVYEIWG